MCRSQILPETLETSVSNLLAISKKHMRKATMQHYLVQNYFTIALEGIQRMYGIDALFKHLGAAEPRYK